MGVTWSWGYPKMDGLQWKCHLEMDENWGYLHLWKPPYGFLGLMKFLRPFQWEKKLGFEEHLAFRGITEFDVWWSREPQNLRVYQWPVDQSAMLPCTLSRKKKIRFCISRWSFQHDCFWQMWAGGLNGFDGFIQNLCKKTIWLVGEKV